MNEVRLDQGHVYVEVPTGSLRL